MAQQPLASDARAGTGNEASVPPESQSNAVTQGAESKVSFFQNLQYRDVLNKGVQAFKKQQFDKAIEDFDKALTLNPSSDIARLYLGTTYAQLVVPDDLSAKSLKNAQAAIALFQVVLAKKPSDVNTLKQIAAVYYAIQEYEQAKEFQLRVVAQDPADVEAEYTIGVIDWQQSYRNANKILGDAGLKDDGLGNAIKDESSCHKLQDANTELVRDGTERLERAINLRPGYFDAMAYLNLMYRRKADLECIDEPGRKADVELAEQWRQRAIALRDGSSNAGNGGKQ